ncbi:MAG: tetratricopeptide repeat protein [Coriobacteriia bacterium]|nr:tetratricopeptide repeat protein [Coriobacteriia bacterium]
MSRSVGPRRSDVFLIAAAALLALLVIGAAGYLGYSVLQTRALERSATPTARAVEELYRIVNDNPNDAQVRVRLGEALAADGRFREAVRELETALTIDADHTGAYLVLGIVGMLQDQHDAAETNFLKIIELTEGTQFEQTKVHRELAFYYLGESALDTGRYEDAVGFFKAAIRVNRANADAYFGLGVAFKGLEEWEAAQDNLEIALVFDPKFAQAHYEMGQVYRAQNDTINAAVHFAKAAEYDPGNDLPLEALAAIGSAEEWEERSRAALAEGDTGTALDSVLVARALRDDNPEYALLHGEVLEAMGESSVALDVYRQALEVNPDHAGLTAAAGRLGDE